MEPTVSSETSAIRTQTLGNYPKRNKLHLEHGESLKTRKSDLFQFMKKVCMHQLQFFHWNFHLYASEVISWLSQQA